MDILNDDGRKKTSYTEITLATWNVQTVLMERGSRKRSSSAGSEKMELVADRKKWKDIVRQAKAHSGL